MNRWNSKWFSNLHAHSKLLYIHISDNCDKKTCWFDVSMAKLRQALKPFTDAEIKAAFKEIASECEITPDRKKVRLNACKSPGTLPFDDRELQHKRKRFIPPTVEEVQLVIKDRKLAQKFINHYTGVDWRVGKNKMVDWQATANNWKLDNEEKNKPEETGKRSLTF